MSRRGLLFRKRDVERAVRAMQATGMQVGRVEIDAEGKIVIVSVQAEPAPVIDELEAWRAKRNARAP